jgi:integrase
VRGSVSKRCGCPARYSASGERLACKIRHGSWSYVADAGRDAKTGKRRQVRGSGFETKKAAEDALAERVDQTAKGMTTNDGQQKVTTFLEEWLVKKVTNGLRPTTEAAYRQHIRQFIVPVIGQLRLRDVAPSHVEEVLRFVGTAGGRARGPASVRRIHATLRSALGTAKRRRLIPFNPAAEIDLPPVQRPKVRPWEPAELGTFLDSIQCDPWAALFETIAATGLRRGEACGLRWSDVDLTRGDLVVRQQLVALPGEQAAPCPYCGGQHLGAVFGKPKTRSGEDRVVELDGGVVGVLMAHKLRQDIVRAQWGDAYCDHGLVFAREDGTPVAPERVTKRFVDLVRAAGLRRVRLHDLRHGQASLMLAANIPMAVVSKRLGHSQLSLTADTYSHLLAGVGRDAAERAAALVPRAAKAAPADPCDQSVTSRTVFRPDEDRPSAEIPVFTGLEGAASENRTPDNLITSEVLYRLS